MTGFAFEADGDARKAAVLNECLKRCVCICACVTMYMTRYVMICVLVCACVQWISVPTLRIGAHLLRTLPRLHMHTHTHTYT